MSKFFMKQQSCMLLLLHALVSLPLQRRLSNVKTHMFIILTINRKYPLFHKVRESGSTIIYKHMHHWEITEMLDTNIWMCSEARNNNSQKLNHGICKYTEACT
jgi:TnpA family transposase